MSSKQSVYKVFDSQIRVGDAVWALYDNKLGRRIPATVKSFNRRSKRIVITFIDFQHAWEVGVIQMTLNRGGTTRDRRDRKSEYYTGRAVGVRSNAFLHNLYTMITDDVLTSILNDIDT